MPIFSNRQRSLFVPLVTIAGFGAAAAIELLSQHRLALDAVIGTGFATAAISALAPREPRKGPAHGHYYLRLAWMAVILIAVGALIALLVKIRPHGRASAWLAVLVVSLIQFVWAARFGRSERPRPLSRLTRQTQEDSVVKRLRLTDWVSVVLASSVLILLTFIGCLDRCAKGASPSTNEGLLFIGVVWIVSLFGVVRLIAQNKSFTDRFIRLEYVVSVLIGYLVVVLLLRSLPLPEAC